MRALLSLLLAGCSQHDTSLYRIDCDSIACPSANVEYLTDDDEYRCWWACRDDVQLNYYFERRGDCWYWVDATEELCDGAETCGWDCLAERFCKRAPFC